MLCSQSYLAYSTCLQQTSLRTTFRCDCKQQLNLALKYVKENGGAVIYLQQEGRGIGLANKIAAYALQDEGYDTVDANLHLGLPEDNRQYGVVPSILQEIGIDSIKLMTNNPRKLEHLQRLGMDVNGTVPMVVERANEYNRQYLLTKKERMRHTNFGDMLKRSNADLSTDRTDVVLNGVMAPQKTINNNNNVKKEQSNAGIQIEGHVMPRLNQTDINPFNTGRKMAENAVRTALLEDEESQSGVQAADDGYCFGRESVERAITAMKNGELVVVVDDEDRENEGDFIIAADLITPESMATMVRYTSGVICIGMEGKRMDELKLPPMCTNNEDPKGTAFSVTVDASKEHGKFLLRKY